MTSKVATGNSFSLTCASDFKEALGARWYQIYVAGFIGLIALFFVFGLTDSQVLGFTGLGRLLFVFIQTSFVILPIFVMVTTARTLVSDRESGVWEYVLSWPLTFRGYYWGKIFGRLSAIIMPLIVAMLLAAVSLLVTGNSVPAGLMFFCLLLMFSMICCFLGISMLVSIFARSQESALGISFVIWIGVEALIDGLLLGLLVRQQIYPEVVIGISLLNPLQAYRVASISLFDPELTVLGPLSYTLLELFGRNFILAWAVAWPLLLGVACAAIGFWAFRKRDVV